MKILFLSHASLTTGFVVGSHQLARQFILQGHDVLHVSSPVSLLNLIKGEDGRAKIKTACSPPNKSEHWGFVDHIPFLPFPYGYQDWLDKINNQWVYRFLKKQSWLDVDLVLIDQPLFHGVLPLINVKKIIYRPTDLYADMGGPRFEKAEAEVFKYTKTIIATSDAVLDNLKKYHPKNTLVLNNGVDLEFFSGQSVKKEARKSQVREGCIYVGAIDFRFDLDLVIALAKSYPDVAFDMYGPCTIALPVELPDNLHLKGSVSYLKLPRLLRQYRIGLLPLNDHPANKGRSPMKLWEYLASNLIVLKKGYKKDSVDSLSTIYYRNIDDIEKKFKTEIKRACQPLDQNTSKLLLEHSWKNKSKQIMNVFNLIT